MRSGIHCILGWIIQNLEDNSVNFYNNIKDVNNLNDRLIKKNDTRIDDIRSKITEKLDAENIVKSFESKRLNFYSPKEDEINIIIIRNPYNNLASSIKYTERFGKHPDIKIDSNFDDLWIEYSDFFLGDNNYIKIIYDKFIRDKNYRIKLSKEIGFDIMNNTVPHLGMGGGSSFINSDEYLTRVNAYKNNDTINKLKKNKRIKENWNNIMSIHDHSIFF